MNRSSPNSFDVKQYLFLPSFARLLLFAFLSLALIPIIILGILSYTQFKHKLLEGLEFQILSIASSKQRYVKDNFEELLRDAYMLTEHDYTLEFLRALKDGLAESGLPPEQYVLSYDWEQDAYTYQNYLETFRRNYSYHDIYLFDLKGNLLYSIGRESVLGKNLFKHGDFWPELKEAYNETIRTGKSRISGFGLDLDSENLPSAYVTSLVLSPEGDAIGITALQFPLAEFDQIMNMSVGLGDQGEAYTIGKDLIMRSNSSLSEEPTILRQKVDTAETRLWRDVHVENEGEEHTKEATMHTYMGYRGNAVFGTHSTVEVGGKNLGIIVEMDQEEALAPVVENKNKMLLTVGIAALVAILVSLILAGRISRPLRKVAASASDVADGDLSRQLKVKGSTEFVELAAAFNHMIRELKERHDNEAQRAWLDRNLQELRDIMLNSHSIKEVLDSTLSHLCRQTEAVGAAIYLVEGGQSLKRSNCYAGYEVGQMPNTIAWGEGFVGQVAKDGQRQIISRKQCRHGIVTSALGGVEVEEMRCEPMISERKLVGVMELLYPRPLDSLYAELIEGFLPILSAGILIEQANQKTRELLEETTHQAKTLQEQQEELKASNEELEEKSEELQSQQDQLRTTNSQLEEQREQLDIEQKALRTKNLELQNMRDELEEKAQQLELSTQYKSEFLANMSHELRTPLNSILLLSRNLASNPEKHLSPEEVRSADVIAKSGNSLLNLINQILDLSKIEARQIKIQSQSLSLEDLRGDLVDLFSEMAKERGLEFEVTLEDGLPEHFLSDHGKIEQILRNLISNALKFTETGGVYVSISDRTPQEAPESRRVSFSVRDTGIGIPKEKKSQIFHAFEQLETGLSKNYAGTGLGLSISQNLVRLLGGFIHLESKEGEGSQFEFDLPSLEFEGERTVDQIDDSIISSSRSEERVATEEDENHPSSDSNDQELLHSGYAVPCEDDREQIQPGDSVVLIIEDDATFAVILRDTCQKRGIKCLLAGNGEVGLELAELHKPNAILLDMVLPGISGEVVLQRLKDNTELRHIPVHILTGSSLIRQLEGRGVLGVLQKPVSREQIENLFNKLEAFWERKERRLLIIAQNSEQREKIRALIEQPDISIDEAQTGEQALRLMAAKSIDCVVVDLALEDMPGEAFLQAYHDQLKSPPPVIIYTGSEFNALQLHKIEALSDSMILRDVKSEERLIDETALFLHRVVADLPPKKQQVISNLYDLDQLLRDKSVLLVDDDMRNLYSLSKNLREHGMKVSQAEDGAKALIQFEDKGFDLILMDLMMPKMHGLDAIRQIRKEEARKGIDPVPIIVLTAKSMPQDRKQCLEAGANEFMSKPIDLDKLFGLMRILLY